MRYHDHLTVEIFTFFLPKKIHCCAFSPLAITSLRNPWDFLSSSTSESRRQFLGLARFRSPVSCLDNLDHMPGMLSSDDAGDIFANPVYELHDILVNMHLLNTTVRTNHVWQSP